MRCMKPDTRWLVKGKSTLQPDEPKITTAGYGLLLIYMGKYSSTAYWAITAQQPENNSWIPSRISKSEK
jgi:hypothetical protein